MSDLAQLAADLHAAAVDIVKPAEKLVTQAALGAEAQAKTAINGRGVAVVSHGPTSVSLVSAARFGVVSDGGPAPDVSIDTARIASRLADAGAKALMGR